MVLFLIVSISIVIVLNHSRLHEKSFQKIYDDQNKDVVLTSSKRKILFRVQKERLLADRATAKYKRRKQVLLSDIVRQ